MEQRYRAIMAVIQDGGKVTEVAAGLGVSRQAVATKPGVKGRMAGFPHCVGISMDGG